MDKVSERLERMQGEFVSEKAEVARGWKDRKWKVKMENRGRVPLDHARDEPKWEEYPHTPAVFVRVATKGLRDTELGRVYGR